MGDHDVDFELFYDSAWQSAPAYIRRAVDIMRGVESFGASLDPASAPLTLAGDDYAPRSVVSPLFGKIGLNTKGRLTADGSVRMAGEVASWKPQRPIKGSGWTDIELAGVLRRLGRGTDPIASAAQRAILPTAPLMYMPLTDGQRGATVSELVGGAGLSVQGAPTFATVTGPDGATKHPQFLSSSGYLGGLSGQVPTAAPGAWTVEFWYSAVAVATPALAVLGVWHTSGTHGALYWVAYLERFGSTDFVVVAAQHDVGSLTSLSTTGIPIDGSWHQVRVTAEQVTPTTCTIRLYVDGVNVDSSVAAPRTVGRLLDQTFTGYDGRLLPLYALNSVESLSLAHATLWATSSPTSTYNQGAGYPGETAADRFARFCLEEGITPTVVGDPAESVAMGPQQPVTRQELLDEIASTDDASIFETRGDTGLTMRTGPSKLNQAAAFTISYLGQIKPPLVPIFGDEGIRNDVTASSPSGATRRVVQETGPHNVQLPEDDPQGVGRYSTRIDVNPEADDALSDAAGWRVNIGTYAGTWYAEVTADLDAAPGIASAVAALEIGDVLGISELPADEAIDTIEGVIIGIRERLPEGGKRRLVTFYLIPADPYRVGVLAKTAGDTDPFVGHLDTDDSTPVLAVDAGASSFLVRTNDSMTGAPLWTQDTDDCPLDVIVGGQRVGISAIGFPVNDAFGRTVAAGSWGSEPTSGVAYDVNQFGNAADCAVAAGVGTMALGGTVLRGAVVEVGTSHKSVIVQASVNVASAAGSSVTQWICGRYQDVNNYAVARLEVTTGGALILALTERVGGVLAPTIASTTLQASGHGSGDVWRVWMDTFGLSVAIYAWQGVLGLKPATPTLTGAITLASGTRLGLLARRETGNTDAGAVSTWDNLMVANPQKFTVDPGGRQVVYPVPAGAAVNVHQPIILAL